jgi:hypothetical protein
VADQKVWVASYSRACGIARDVSPSLPLTPAIKRCMAQVGRARIVYLRGYGLPAARNLTPEAPAARPITANAVQFAQGLRDRAAGRIGSADCPATQFSERLGHLRAHK